MEKDGAKSTESTAVEKIEIAPVVAGSHQAAVKTNPMMFWITTFIFVFTIVGCLMYLIIAEPDQESKAFSYLMFTFRLMAALSAAMIVAMLPGFIDLDWMKNAGVRAGGAMAAFLIVWWTNPPELVSGLAEQVAFNTIYSKCGGGDYGTRRYDTQDLPYCEEIVAKWGDTRWEAALIDSRISFQNKEYEKADNLLESALLMKVGKTSNEIDIDFANKLPKEDLTDLYQLIRAKTLSTYKLSKFVSTGNYSELGRQLIELMFGDDQSSVTYRQSVTEMAIARISALGSMECKLNSNQVKELERLVTDDVENNYVLKPYLKALAHLYKKPVNEDAVKKNLLENAEILATSVDRYRGEYIMQLKCLTIFPRNKCQYKGGSLPISTAMLSFVSSDDYLTNRLSTLN